MKKLSLCVALALFAVSSSVLAGNNPPAKTSAVKNTDSCCDSKDCCSQKKADKTAKSACSKGMPSRHVFMSPKAAANAGKS
ncbi:MAG TPA: hypothetical protein VFB72_12165 [Verrucomicrobiae bacterium]|nr:hypothetical protein [Verrucomicrobiae bacterium]